MVPERFQRTALLLGDEAMDKLAAARVIVFGLGGVGGYAVEALARAGVGALDIVDNDTISQSNINRQILALDDTIGRPKTEVEAERIAKISPGCRVTVHNIFFMPDTAELMDLSPFSYAADAIDTVTAKLEIIGRAKAAGIPVISCMGTGNKLDPSRLRVTDIYRTTVCPLARVMRSQLRKRDIDSLKVVFSDEEPLRAVADSSSGRHAPGSVSFVPPCAGMLMASEIIRDICGK